ncbi:MAG: hypothetical protein R3F61_24755 [Myxococcota bacterium]
MISGELRHAIQYGRWAGAAADCGPHPGLHVHLNGCLGRVPDASEAENRSAVLGLTEVTESDDAALQDGEPIRPGAGRSVDERAHEVESAAMAELAGEADAAELEVPQHDAETGGTP